MLDEFADEDLRDRVLERGNPRQYVSGGMLGTFDFCPRCFEYVFLEGVKRDVYAQYCRYNTKMEGYTHCKYNTKWELFMQ